MKKRDQPARHWILTIWNNLDENEEKLRERPESPFCQATWQREKAPNTGKIHIQGYVTFKQKQRLSKLQQLFGAGNHFEVMRGSCEDARNYSSKPETREQPGGSWGALEQLGQGKRSDLQSACAAIKDGKKFSAVVREHTEVAVKYYANLEKVCSIVNGYKPKPTSNFAWRSWQLWLNGKLEEQPDDRTVIWILDTRGGAGKTRWSTEFFARNPDDCYLTGVAKGDRQFYAYGGQRVVIYDICRSIQPEEGEKSMFPYQQLEHFKNGSFPAGMYGTQPKYFEIPHVIVLANWRPDFAKLSQDRWLLVSLDDFDWHSNLTTRIRVTNNGGIRSIIFEADGDEGPSDPIPSLRRRGAVFLD